MPEPVINHSDGTRDHGRIIRAQDGWELHISPSDLTFIRIDHQTRLQFGDTEVVIACPFVLRIGDMAYDLDDRAGLGPLLALYPDVLVAATVDQHATLRLTFETGATITVPSDLHYEAWQVNGPGTFLVVCVPGDVGDLAIWS